MTNARTVAGELAEFLEDCRYEQIPDEALHAARRCLMDFCGSALRGSMEPPARMARNVAEQLMHGSGARRFPDAGESSPAGAAFVNGVSSHIVELDDLHNPSTFHPGAPIIPAVLAAAEATGAPGSELLRAIVLGYEIGIRVAEAVNPSHYTYWHPTGTCGVFGAAAGVGVILGLDVTQHANTLGSAGTQASGLWAFLAEGAMSKHLHTGRAAENGLVAAYLAREGFTGAHGIVESPRGFVAATTDGANPWAVVTGLGIEPLKILENGFKVHACCGHTHTAIDLAIEMGERLPVEQMRGVRVGTYKAALAVAGIEDPRSGYEARFSLGFTIATGLLHGRADLASFADDRVYDADVRDLMSRINIDVDPKIENAYPDSWGCSMEITMSNGETVVATAGHPRGMPANALSDDELTRKYLDLAGAAIEADRATRLADYVWKLPDGMAPDLMDILDVTPARR